MLGITVINYVLKPSDVFQGQMFSIVVRMQTSAQLWENRTGMGVRGLLKFYNVFCFEW